MRWDLTLISAQWRPMWILTHPHRPHHLLQRFRLLWCTRGTHQRNQSMVASIGDADNSLSVRRVKSGTRFSFNHATRKWIRPAITFRRQNSPLRLASLSAYSNSFRKARQWTPSNSMTPAVGSATRPNWKPSNITQPNSKKIWHGWRTWKPPTSLPRSDALR